MWNNENMWDKLKSIHDEFHERIEEMQMFGGLRMWILHVLDEHGPKNGVEIMDAVQTHYYAIHQMYGLHKMHHGSHKHSKRPSPGSIYPMLKKMVAEGLINKREDGRYELAEKGQTVIIKLLGHFRPHENINHGSFAIESALSNIDGYIAYLEDIKKEKLTPHENLIENLSERLKKIKESLNEE